MRLFTDVGVIRGKCLENPCQLVTAHRPLGQHADIVIAVIKAAGGKTLVGEPYTIEDRGIIILDNLEVEYTESRTVHPVKLIQYVLPVPGGTVLPARFHSGCTYRLADTSHERKALQGILQRRLILHGNERKVEKVRCIAMHRPVLRLAHLRLHRNGKCDQDDGERVLQHDEDFAEYHFGLAPVSSLHHFQRIILAGHQCGYDTADGAHREDGRHISDDIARLPGYPHRHGRIAQKPVHHRAERLSQQETRPEAHGSEQDGLDDVFTHDTSLRCSGQLPDGHFLRSFPRKCDREVHIVEDGGKKKQKAY